MEHFQLTSATMAVHYQDGGPKGLAVMIPAGSEVSSAEPIDVRPGFDHSLFVEVQWAGRTVRMFLLDLIERSNSPRPLVDSGTHGRGRRTPIRTRADADRQNADNNVIVNAMCPTCGKTTARTAGQLNLMPSVRCIHCYRIFTLPPKA
jgi:hypothetical protein